MEDSVFLLAKPSNGFEDPAAVRKLQKAGREKKRRDLLNEHFCQLETALLIGIIKRKALIKDLAAFYHAQCLDYCQELLSYQRKWEEVPCTHFLRYACHPKR